MRTKNGDNVPLTDTKLRGLKPEATVYRIADTNGLTIEVRPTGLKFWRYRYRFAGKPTMLTLGEYPATGLADARAARDTARAQLKAGVNPAQVVQAKRAAGVLNAETTFGAIAKEMLAKRTKEGLSAGSIAREERMVEKELAGLVSVPIADVTAPMLLAALRKVESRGVIETAHRARSLAGMVFRYAIATARATYNPAADLAGALQAPKKQHFASVTDPDKVGDLLRAIHAYQGSPTVMAALKLAPLVFVRPGELRTAQWAHIDLDAAEWRFTASKTGTPHIVPLSTQAVAILTELQPFTQRSDYVFPSIRSAKRPMSENTVNVALKAMGFDGETMTGHGFRAMARTILDEVLGYRPDFIEHQLAHAVRDPNGRAYNRTAHLPERKKMMQGWSDYLENLRTDTSKKVVPMKRNASGKAG